MKRLIVVTLLVITATSVTGCRRGVRLWGLRGARCAAPRPTFTPMPPPAMGYPAAGCQTGCPTGCPPAYPAYAPAVTTQFPCDGCGVSGMPGVSGVPADFGPSINGPYYGTPMEGGVPSVTPDSSGTTTTGTLPPMNSPMNFSGSDSAHLMPNQPVFSHTVGDRKLQPGETLKGQVVLPMESAAAKTDSEKK